ncbi:MAG: response regulator [Elusimicrobia bacterium]|nr:response regulator [Elusimicrobiota bacterium]
MTHRTKILVIDDEKDIGVIIARCLTRHGYRVHCVTGGKRGLDEAMSGKFDMVIVDWTMPEQSGAEIINQLRASQETHDLPILVVTGKRNPDFLDDSLNVGADDFLFKPFALRHLAKKVGRLLHWASA